jgi:endonuclease/exonuclease/phosphatase family metal-dependent hydrolase
MFTMCSLMAAAPSTTRSSSDLRVMSFNLRCSTADDGPDNWANRRDILVQAIRRENPDLLGTQECVADQGAYLQQHLPEMTFVGVGRNDGKRAGEFAAIFFRTARFELMNSGTFWLSPTPDQVGSKGWDANSIRIVTYARLRDRSNGRVFAWLNTHWDHIGKQARLESAGMMRRWIDANAPDVAVLITGDFNTHLDAPPYARMFDPQEWKRHLTDTYALLHGGNGGGTYHGFKGKGTGVRIDWIICSDEFQPQAAQIDTFNLAGRYPSDHFPITAELSWRP